MFESLRNTITLDLDSRGIRLLATRGCRVHKWANMPLERGLVKDGLVTDPEAVAAALKQLMSCSGIRGRKVVASISNQYSISRLLHLPPFESRAGGGQLLELIKHNMPMPDDFHVSFQSLGEDDSGIWVFAVGVPGDVINGQVQAMRRAGLKPSVLNLKALAIMRLVPAEQAVILNLEPDSADIVLAVDSVPRIMRTVSVESGMTLGERVEELAERVDQTTSFFELQYPETPLFPELPLYLAGQGADDPDLMLLMSQRTSRPLLPLEVPLECPPSLPISQYAVNIGLAVRQIATPRSPSDQNEP